MVAWTVQTTELVNTAVLSEHIVSWPMNVYLLTHTGRATDITRQSTCHSQDERVLKVSTSSLRYYSLQNSHQTRDWDLKKFIYGSGWCHQSFVSFPVQLVFTGRATTLMQLTIVVLVI